MKLNDKTIIVTGGARGIGQALSQAFAREGARVVVADLLEEDAKSVAAEIGGLGVPCDVSKESDIQNLVRRAEEAYGPVDLFCSNAGICVGEPDHSASASNETDLPP
jgi:NAD(P)-dependent dehydrogenase (short-subunit alcohol dehydrogenase family)